MKYYQTRTRNDPPWVDVYRVEDGEAVNINDTDEAKGVLWAGIARDVRHALRRGVPPSQVLEDYLDLFAEGKEPSGELLDTLDALKGFLVRVMEGEVFNAR
jgi:hypothetical protein